MGRGKPGPPVFHPVLGHPGLGRGRAGGVRHWFTGQLSPQLRVDNSIAYRGTFSGLTLGAEYSLGRDTVSGIPGPNPAATNCAGESATDKQACRQWSAAAKYDAANWGAVLSYDTLNGRTPASATDVVFGGLNSSSTSDSRTLVGVTSR